MRRIFQLTAAFLLLGCFLNLQAAPARLDYLPGRLLVRFAQDIHLEKTATGGVATGVAEIDRLMDRFSATGFQGTYEPYIIQNPEFRHFTRNDKILFFPETTDMELVAKEFDQLSSVEEAIPDWLLPIFESCPTNDPDLGAMWWINRISAKEAWCFNTGNTEILVAAIDSGHDWNHPDYMDNVWINREEDPTGDIHEYENFHPDFLMSNVAEANDGVDNDGNGLIDDFLGWDFITSATGAAPGEDNSNADNNPMDFNGHGTGVSGAMAQVGNNSTGTVGVAYNARMIALRCGYQNSQGLGLIVTSAALNGIAYAVDKGAKVINMSYGGGGFSSQVNSAMVNAWNSGALLFGATGNDGVGTLQYPAAYANVIAVGATNQSDGRAGFSNYGNWVNISAPGTACRTGWFNDTYDTWDGTSVASPIAAGVGALVIDAFPDSSNTFWRMVVESTTDPITTDQPLGTGRVNAYKAVTQFKYPQMSIDSVEVLNVGENQHPDPGETFNVYVSLSNEAGWMDAENVTIHVSFDMDELTVPVNDVVIGTVSNGGTGDNSEVLIEVNVSEDAPDGAFTTMFVTVTADPNDYVIETSRRLLVGTPNVLVVDDDGGAAFETYIAADLDALDEIFHSFDVFKAGAPPSLDILTAQPIVFWMTGNTEDPLSQQEQELISALLDAGISLFLFGQTIDDQLSGTDFYADILHAETADGTIALPGLDAIEGAGGPIVDGHRLLLQGDSGANNSTDPDIITALPPAVESYVYFSSGVRPNGGLYIGTDSYKLIYLAFAFEAVGGVNNTTPRRDAVAGYLNWFRGGSSVPDGGGGSSPLPSTFAIESAYPNPFNPSTTLRIALPHHAHARLVVYDLLGRETATLLDRQMNAGHHAVTWNAAEGANGIYFAVLEAGGTRSVVKLAFVK